MVSGPTFASICVQSSKSCFCSSFCVHRQPAQSPWHAFTSKANLGVYGSILAHGNLSTPICACLARALLNLWVYMWALLGKPGPVCFKATQGGAKSRPPLHRAARSATPLRPQKPGPQSSARIYNLFWVCVS